MLNEIEAKFGKDCLIGYGNWSITSQMAGCIPTPNVHLKKLLAKRFAVVDVDENNTSKLYNKPQHGEYVVLDKMKIKKGSRKQFVYGLLFSERGNRTLYSRKQRYQCEH
jgi:hypothetical protein